MPKVVRTAAAKKKTKKLLTTKKIERIIYCNETQKEEQSCLITSIFITFLIRTVRLL